MKRMLLPLMMLCAGTVPAMDFIDLTAPDAVKVDGRPAGARVALAGDGTLTLNGGTASCVGLVNAGDIPWHLNRQWLDLVARSGTALFTSWKRSLAADPEVARALGAAWKTASRPAATGEPLDWLETPRPQRWRFGDGDTVTYDWDERR